MKLCILFLTLITLNCLVFAQNTSPTETVIVATADSVTNTSTTKTIVQKSVDKLNQSAETSKTDTTVAAIDEDDITPNIDKSVTYDYKCELNDKFTIYTNADDDDHAALRWKNRLYRLKRIQTTSGANRFENKKAGLVWIGIPQKSMLLDSLHGEQLANECKTSTQRSNRF